jgi:DNA-binding transcriptional LysR family regulator
LQLEQLQYLVEVSRTKSLNQAAQRIYVSPQSLGSAIRKLEQECQVSLLRRSSTGVTLSPDGEAFVRVAEEIIARMEELRNWGRQQRDECRLNFYTTYSLNQEIFSRRATDFCREHPNFQITFSSKPRSEILKSLPADSKSCALLLEQAGVFSEDAYGEMGLKVVKSRPDRLVVCVSRTMPLSRQKSTSVREVLKYPFVSFEYQDDDVPCGIDILKRCGEPNVVLSTSNMHLFWQTIAGGAAIGFAMEEKTTANKIPEQYGINLVPLRTRRADFDYVFFLLKPEKSSLSPAENEFLLRML